MATVKKQGKGYKITASAGFDYNGNRIRRHLTWIPPDGMTQRQIEKELQRQIVLFEERVNAGLEQDASLRFGDYIDQWLEQYARKQLKPKTVAEYEKLAPTIKTALGHIKLKDLKTGHLNSFYSNLQEQGIRNDTKYVRAIDLASVLKEKKLTKEELHRRTGLAVKSITAAVSGKNVSRNTAEELCLELGVSLSKSFKAIGENNTLSATSVRHYHSMISSCLGKAVKWGYLTTNPATNAELPRVDLQEASHLDVDAARRLMELLQQEPLKYRAAITFDILSGLRRGELLGLRWQDVDFDNEIIRIVQTLSYVHGKGLIFDSPKNKTSARVLRLSGSAFAILRELQEWQAQQEAMLGDAWCNTADLVFTGDDGSPLHPDTLTKWFRKLCQKNNLPAVHIHSLRHTYASLMIADGTPLVVVSRRLGHAQVSTTANIYAHVIASADEKAARVTDVFNDVIPVKPELSAKNGISDMALKKASGTKLAPE